jgi:predicted nucleotidyltransferase
METASEHLRARARSVLGATLERVSLRAALLAGSAARGDADQFSDIDLIAYVDQLPPAAVLREIRDAVGGTDPFERESTEHFRGEEFALDGIRTELSFLTVARVEWHLDRVFKRVEEFDSPLQKVLVGLLEGLPLHGQDLIEQWRARVREYPEPLRAAIVQRRWDFEPLWYHEQAIAARDAVLWRLDILLDAAFNLLATLAALNRLYFARFELKRMRHFVANMELAPPRLADRLESLFVLDPPAAAAELERLIEETRELVLMEMPDVELPMRFPPGTRQRPWGT